MAQLLNALSEVITALDRRSALVGGIAVAARLGRVERTTSDVDTVVDAPEAPPSAELLIRAGTAEKQLSASSVSVHGVTVDLIDTFAVPDQFFVDAAGANDLFVAAHRFGLETATPLRLIVRGGPEVLTEVAAPPGLVAMKLHAACWRRDRAKLPGDLFDIFRLLTTFDRDGEIAAVLTTSTGLGRLCLEAAEVLFVERLTASAGAMLRSDDAVIASVTRDDLAAVGEAFVGRLRH